MMRDRHDDFPMRREWLPELGGSSKPCKSRNEIWSLSVWGATDGTLSIEITIQDDDKNAVAEEISLDYDATAEEIETAILGHSELEEGDVSVIGGPLNTNDVSIEWQGNLAKTDMIRDSSYVPRLDRSNLSGAGALITRWTPGLS